MFPEVQDGKYASTVWTRLWEKQETSDKGRPFYLKSMLFLVNMIEGD